MPSGVRNTAGLDERVKMKYSIDHDLHIHSYLTPCAGHPPTQNAENILAYGKRMKMKELCITDHFWDSENVPVMETSWFKNYNYPYVSKILPFPEDSEVRLHLGCETDMDLLFNVGVSDKLYDKLEFIIVATSHMHAPGWTVKSGKMSVSDRAALYMERNHRLLDMDLPFRKVGLAHFTCSLIVGECEGTSFEILDHISDGEYRELFDRAASLGMGIELNMTFDEIRSESCLRPYRIAKECGCRFYLGSDAHTLGGFDSAERRFTAMIDALALTEDDKFRVFE